MRKLTCFADIPRFTSWGSYSVNVSWDYVEKTLDEYAKAVRVDLDPDFQRAHVWTAKQQSRYVEYILRGGKSSRDIYWNCKGWHLRMEGPMVLVDGKQRLEAVRKFMANKLPAFGSTFSEYTDRMRLIETGFVFHVNDLATRAEVLQWYIDINAGGVAHTEAEIAKVRALLDAEAAPSPLPAPSQGEPSKQGGQRR